MKSIFVNTIDVHASIPSALMDELIADGDLQRYLHTKGAPLSPAHLPSIGRFVLELDGSPVQFAMGYTLEGEGKRVEAVLVVISALNLPRKFSRRNGVGWLLFTKTSKYEWVASRMGIESAPDASEHHGWDWLYRIALELKDAEK